MQDVPPAKSTATRHWMEFLLAIASIGSLLFLQMAEGNEVTQEDAILGSIAIPWVYVLLAKLLARSTFPRAARTAYMFGFLSGGIGLARAAEEFGAKMFFQDSQTNPLPPDAVAALLTELTQAIVRHMLPFLSGLGAYVVFSTFERETDATPTDLRQQLGQTLGQLEKWLAATDAPQVVRQVLGDLAARADELGKSYAELARQSTSTRGQMEAVGSAALEATRGIRELNTVANELGTNMKSISRELHEARAELGQIGSAVVEIGEVVDQFSEIAAHQILNFKETSHA